MSESPRILHTTINISSDNVDWCLSTRLTIDVDLSIALIEPEEHRGKPHLPLHYMLRERG